MFFQFELIYNNDVPKYWTAPIMDDPNYIENMMIEIGDKNKSEIFVKYEKSGYRPFLVPKSAKNSHFSV